MVSEVCIKDKKANLNIFLCKRSKLEMKKKKQSSYAHLSNTEIILGFLSFGFLRWGKFTETDTRRLENLKPMKFPSLGNCVIN